MEYKEQVITYKGKIVFVKLSMPNFDRTLKQYVEDEACFMFVNKGEINVRTPEEYFQFNRNTGMLAKCLNYFFEPSDNKDRCKEGIESIGVFLYPSLVKELFEFDLIKTSNKSNFSVKQVQIDKLLEHYKEGISLLLETPELVDDALIKSKLKEFIMLVTKSSDAPSELEFLQSLFQPVEIDFKKVIQQNLFANLSIEELSALCHLSTSSFKRKFKEVFAESPKKYLNRKKIEKAAELLKNRELRVSDVAYDVGFDSLATFNRNFTELYGKSPSQYRLD